MGKKVYWSVPAKDVHPHKLSGTDIVDVRAMSEQNKGDIAPEDVPKTIIGAKVGNYKFVLDYLGAFAFTDPDAGEIIAYAWSNHEFTSFYELAMFIDGPTRIDGAVALFILNSGVIPDPPSTGYTDYFVAHGKNYSVHDPWDLEIYELDDFEKLAKNYSDAEAVTPKAPIVEALKRYYTVVEHIPAETFKDCDTIADVLDAASKQ